MGTNWSVKLINDRERGFQEQQLSKDIQTVLDRIESAMSNWRDDSDVSRFNRLSEGCLLVSEDTETVARASREISEQSEGYFDPTVSPLIEIWGFGVREQPPEEPDAEQLQAALDNTGYRYFSVDERQLCKTNASIHLNFSAIAKGYAVDEVANLLASRDIDRFLVEVGGELYGEGSNIHGESWSVGVETPDYGWPQGVYSILNLDGNAVATSGDYRNYYVLNGQKFNHILNPRTGRPVAHGAASVTVIHESTMLADGWATALLAAGPEEGIRLANNAGVAAYMILREQDHFISTQSQFWPEESQ
ncbi:MAG: FAD:protein FMN transferase [Porticoccaceae bacterium]